MHQLFRGCPSSSAGASAASAPSFRRDNPRVVKFKNCRLLRNHELLEGEELWVRNGIIVDGKTQFWEGRQPDEVVDCGGKILAPGFIDIQASLKRREEPAAILLVPF